MLGVVMTVGRMPAQSEPVVDVTGGRIRGEQLTNGGSVFRGLPYAAPPTDDLRWREPMPVRPWAGIRDATVFGAICPQNLSPPLRNPQALMSELRVNEDCLSLNIWTPEWPMRDARPVLVWLPGGGNIFGGSIERRQDGQYLARRGIVVVTINYRLGSFGFFSHRALTAESPQKASGNQGLLDQIAALRWVRANIAAFGGNPAAVTLGGNSAGGVDTTVLMTSPLAEGLFARAIIQSGPARSVLGEPLTRAEAERRGVEHTATWGAAPGASLAELRSIPIETILKTQPPRPVSHLNVSIDGYVLPSAPASVFANGRQRGVPSIIGSAARDFAPGAEPPTDLPALIADTYGPLAERARTLYAVDDAVYGTPAVQLATDLGFRCGTVLQLKEHTSAGHIAYAYEFARLATPPIQRAAISTVSTDSSRSARW